MVSDTIRRDLWGLTPPRRSRRAPWPCRPLVRTVTLVIERLLQPLRTAATWRSLVHAVLDLPVGLATFVPIVILLALSGPLLIPLPLALPVRSDARGVGNEGVSTGRSRWSPDHKK